MSDDLQQVLLGLMATLCNCINRLDASANELMMSADLLEDKSISNTMRDIARGYRVKILEMHGQIAALNTAFTDLFGTDV